MKAGLLEEEGSARERGRRADIDLNGLFMDLARHPVSLASYATWILEREEGKEGRMIVGELRGSIASPRIANLLYDAI